MDIGSIAGLVFSFALFVMSIFTSGGTIMTYVDVPSFLMVVLGSYASIFLSVPMKLGLGLFGTIGLCFKVPVLNELGMVQKLLSFSDKARREGLLALEDELEDLDDEFMKKGLRMVVDGTDAAIIRDLMDTEISGAETRHGTKMNVLTQWSALGPGYGMLGTVVGLIAMLKNLEDKSSIGPNMALALVTTLYGSMMQNMLLNPFISKLTIHDADESHVKEMVLEGILSIQAGDNPRTLEMKMMAYLTPDQRKQYQAANAAGGND
jgi:chemotaxis protein MotA